MKIQSKLVGPNGQPIEYDVLTQEISAPSLTGIRTVWGQPQIASGLTPTMLAQVLIAASQNDPWQYCILAEEMEEREPHYAAVLGTRKRGVSGLEIATEAASDDPLDIKIADAVREIVRAPEFGDVVDATLDGLGKGYAVAEIIWDRGQMFIPIAYKWREPRFFRFDWNTGEDPQLIDTLNIMGTPLQPYKFVVHKPRLKMGIPLRGGLARLAATAYMCKSYTLTDWLAYAEVFGIPLRVGRYDANATQQDINILKTAVANLGSDAAAVLPAGMQIEFIQNAQGAGGAELFHQLAEWLDQQTSKAVLGQTATTDAQPTGLGSATATVHNEVRIDILKSDCKQLERTLNRDVVKAFVDLNFGEQPHYPRLQFLVPRPEDIGQLTDSLSKLVPLGLRVEQSVIRDKLGLPEPEPEAELLTAPAAPTNIPPPATNALALAKNAAELAQGGDEDTIDKLAAQATDDWQPLMDPLLAPLRGIIEGATDEQDLLAKLPAALDAMNPTALIKSLALEAFKARGLGDAKDAPK